MNLRIITFPSILMMPFFWAICLMWALSSGESCGFGWGRNSRGWMRGLCSLGRALMVLGRPVLTASARDARQQRNSLKCLSIILPSLNSLYIHWQISVHRMVPNRLWEEKKMVHCSWESLIKNPQGCNLLDLCSIRLWNKFIFSSTFSYYFHTREHETVCNNHEHPVTVVPWQWLVSGNRT